MPEFLIMHWDGKVIKYENRHETDDRLAVVASFRTQDMIRYQFLAAPLIPDSTGNSMRLALQDTLNEWEIPGDNIIGMSWDTTSSNTGKNLGSATLFEQDVGHRLLWLGCRHHIGELHVKHADVEVRGAWHGL